MKILDLIVSNLILRKIKIVALVYALKSLIRKAGLYVNLIESLSK